MAGLVCAMFVVSCSESETLEPQEEAAETKGSLVSPRVIWPQTAGVGIPTELKVYYGNNRYTEVNWEHGDRWGENPTSMRSLYSDGIDQKVIFDEMGRYYMWCTVKTTDGRQSGYSDDVFITVGYRSTIRIMDYNRWASTNTIAVYRKSDPTYIDFYLPGIRVEGEETMEFHLPPGEYILEMETSSMDRVQFYEFEIVDRGYEFEAELDNRSVTFRKYDRSGM